MIKIKNTGANPVTEVVFNYGIAGGASSSYTWTGTLNFLEEAIVQLGPTLQLYNGNTTNQFNVAIDKVNGISGDDNSFFMVFEFALVNILKNKLDLK